MKGYMTLNTRAMNHTHEPAPASDRSRRTLTRVVVLLLSGWAGGVGYAGTWTFPSQPLQTGVVQPAPNVIFILDDSLSMIGAGGEVLDTGLTWCSNATCPNSPNLDGDTTNDDGDGDVRAPYTKNPLSYDPHTDYRAWATANTTDTSVVRLTDCHIYKCQQR